MAEKPPTHEPQEISASLPDGYDLFYEPTPSYRSIYADGAVVAPSDADMISVTFYNERLAIPKQVRMVLDKTDSSISENYVSGKQGTIRYLENTVFLSKKSAKALIAWLESVTEFLDDQSSDKESAGGEGNV